MLKFWSMRKLFIVHSYTMTLLLIFFTLQSHITSLVSLRVAGISKTSLDRHSWNDTSGGYPSWHHLNSLQFMWMKHRWTENRKSCPYPTVSPQYLLEEMRIGSSDAHACTHQLRILHDTPEACRRAETPLMQVVPTLRLARMKKRPFLLAYIHKFKTKFNLLLAMRQVLI